MTRQREYKIVDGNVFERAYDYSDYMEGNAKPCWRYHKPGTESYKLLLKEGAEIKNEVQDRPSPTE